MEAHIKKEMTETVQPFLYTNFTLNKLEWFAFLVLQPITCPITLVQQHENLYRKLRDSVIVMNFGEATN